MQRGERDGRREKDNVLTLTSLTHSLSLASLCVCVSPDIATHLPRSSERARETAMERDEREGMREKDNALT